MSERLRQQFGWKDQPISFHGAQKLQQYVLALRGQGILNQPGEPGGRAEAGFLLRRRNRGNIGARPKSALIADGVCRSSKQNRILAFARPSVAERFGRMPRIPWATGLL